MRCHIYRAQKRRPRPRLVYGALVQITTSDGRPLVQQVVQFGAGWPLVLEPDEKLHASLVREYTRPT